MLLKSQQVVEIPEPDSQSWLAVAQAFWVLCLKGKNTTWAIFPQPQATNLPLTVTLRPDSPRCELISLKRVGCSQEKVNSC